MITRKIPVILAFAFLSVFIAAGSAFLDMTEPTERIRYTVEKEGLRLDLDERGVRIEGITSALFHERNGDKVVTTFDDGFEVVYTIDPVLQDKISGLFAQYRVPYGAFVAISPKSGKVLAMVEYSDEHTDNHHLALRATYPAASVFKLITAAAAVETGKADPETVIRYNGGLYSLTPRNWVDNPRRDKNKITLADAMGKSCNVAFAKVALRWLGSEGLIHYANLFGFNKTLDFELPIQTSQFIIENTEESIARTAAGFGNVTLSPLHGAMIASAIGNSGKMIAPRIIDRITRDGRDIYNYTTKELDFCISEETASKLKYMMKKTVESGTSRHAFYTPNGRAYLKDISIGGKTGSLEGNDPPGDYSWFVGMAPLDDPEIAVASLVINRPLWHIKAPLVAREALLTYFNNDRSRYARLQ